MSAAEFLTSATKRKARRQVISETTIEDTFVNFAKKQCCLPLKLVRLNIKGFPDRTILCPNGRILFIEFKKKGEPLTPAQRINKKLIRALGFAFHTCDEIGQAERILKRFLAGH